MDGRCYSIVCRPARAHTPIHSTLRPFILTFGHASLIAWRILLFRKGAWLLIGGGGEGAGTVE